eukprot:GILI01005250.1.p1 GENE.GILI01005250.1~~GILI01005250.1.p1  ORF type:complete len:133 (+),score=30.06 GILI01005250.1:36-401(+)
MFGRRVFASAPIPPSMFARLNISSVQQAQRRLPSLMPINAAMARSMGSSSLVQLLTGAGGGLVMSQQLAMAGSSDAVLEQINLILSGALGKYQAPTVTSCLWNDVLKKRMEFMSAVLRQHI